MVASWIAQRDRDDVVREFERAEAAISPIYDVTDVLADPQYQALQSIVDVPDDELGSLKMQNVLFRMLGTPGRIRWPGRPRGHDTAEVFGELGVSDERLAELQTAGVV